MSSPEEKAKEVFGRRASFYTTSASHTDPRVLERVLTLSGPQPHWAVLDVATGAGHTAFALAPHVTSGIGLDLTVEMLAEAERSRCQRSIANVTFRIGDVHRLPFQDEAFQLITCRRAAHHFSNIRQALREMRRVLQSGGRLVIDDRSVPEDDFLDECMNRLDTLHDESHVREYRPSRWRELLEEAGFRVDIVDAYIKHRPLTSLTEGVSEPNVRRIKEVLDGLLPPQREAFDLREKNGELHLNHWFVMIAAEAA